MAALNTPCLAEYAALPGAELVGSPTYYDSDDSVCFVPGRRHFERNLSVGFHDGEMVVDGPKRSCNEFFYDPENPIVYSPPPSPGESRIAQQRRRDRHRGREETALRRLELRVAKKLGREAPEKSSKGVKCMREIYVNSHSL